MSSKKEFIEVYSKFCFFYVDFEDNDCPDQIKEIMDQNYNIMKKYDDEWSMAALRMHQHLTDIYDLFKYTKSISMNDLEAKFYAMKKEIVGHFVDIFFEKLTDYDKVIKNFEEFQKNFYKFQKEEKLLQDFFTLYEHKYPKFLEFYNKCFEHEQDFLDNYFMGADSVEDLFISFDRNYGKKDFLIYLYEYFYPTDSLLKLPEFMAEKLNYKGELPEERTREGVIEWLKTIETQNIINAGW